MQTISTKSGVPLVVEEHSTPQDTEVCLRLQTTKPCLLHWGVRRLSQSAWELPPREFWPADTREAGNGAAQTPFAKHNAEYRIVIRLPVSAAYASIDFVLFFPDRRRWDNNDNQNYCIHLLPPARSQAPLEPAFREQIGQQPVLFERLFEVESEGRLAVGIAKAEAGYRTTLLTDLPGPLLLHWGIARFSSYDWFLPPAAFRPPGTVVSQSTAQTPFTARPDGLCELRLEFREPDAPLGVQFVLKQADTGRWLKYRGGNFFIPISIGYEKVAGVASPALSGVVEQIVKSEMGQHSWTLMHRFNRCFDLLEQVRNDTDGLALLFVWLRFSALRQLTWQRNYNTQPRELAHAQDRLTRKLADFYRHEPASRPLARLMLTTVGRGGEGQQIRDEILNIMHRHHIKEVAGHFLEEWHQKLHNNTTPDDVVLCDAYVEFLRSNGHLDRFYQVLEAGGVTKGRLEGFERPIRSHPDFIPHLKDALIHDFQHFLAVLKSVHSGTDLETAINAARPQLDGGTQGLLAALWQQRDDPRTSLVHVLAQATEVRRRLRPRLAAESNVRELLYLDFALEQLARLVVERNLHVGLNGDQLVDLTALVLENLTFSDPDAELALDLRRWERLIKQPRFGQDWSLHAKAALDRIARSLSATIDRTYQLLQPKAELLGNAFHADAWTISLFSEEVVRGTGVGFGLSMLVHHLDPMLRNAAQLGNWQIISRGRGHGKVEVVASLHDIQGQYFDSPRVIIADQVMGDEELPEAVTAVIAPNVTDIVSHVAVRARNAQLLFAACYDDGLLQHLKSLRGQEVDLEINAAGDVVVTPATVAARTVPTRARLAPRPTLAPQFIRYAVTASDFNDQRVGGKSCHLAGLRNRLPDWIHLPASVALPFGVFEKILLLPENKPVAERYESLLPQVEGEPAKTLPELRGTVLQLTAPEKLVPALREAMSQAGLPWPADWDAAWKCIKRVWASKWNERAYLSRKTMGIAHAELFMAVLIQQVVEADYAFVIHTVSPLTGNPQELFAEVVLGLGETLVGNYPGRALSFICDKTTEKQTLLSYPNKSTGLYGGGLIFRSDSNGEDLAGYAGAGLYDSVLLDAPRQVAVDYAQEPLVWDPEFRQRLLSTITKIGVEVERACGSPQDLEGALVKDKCHVVQTRPQVGVK